MKKMLLIVVFLLGTSTAFASNADDISKNVNSLIRSAENKYFSGKANEAAALLLEVQDNLVKLQAQDSNHKSLKRLQTKYERLKVKVDKKLGTSSASRTSSTKVTSDVAQSSSSGKALSSGAKSNLKKANREMDFADKEFVKGEKSLQDKKFNLVDSSIYNAKSKLENAEGLLDRVIKSNKADPNHPDIASALQRHKDLQAKLTTFTNRAHGEEKSMQQASAQANKDAAKLNSTWLPKIMPFTDGLSDSRLQYPGSYNEQERKRQEKLYAQAMKVLEDVQNSVPIAHQPDELKRAIDSLSFTLKVYEDTKKADSKNRLQPIESTLADWEKQFEKNRQWSDKSEQGLFIITEKKLTYQKQQIDALRSVLPAKAADCSKKLATLEKENKSWVEKKNKWMERPRPFPQAKMKSKSLEKEMVSLLEDRGIAVDDFVIVDKDWWVQHGEFRYLAAAVLSKDKKGKYWSKVTFRQMQTLSGYAPLGIWQVNEIKIRLP